MVDVGAVAASGKVLLRTRGGLFGIPLESDDSKIVVKVRDALCPAPCASPWCAVRAVQPLSVLADRRIVNASMDDWGGGFVTGAPAAPSVRCFACG